MYLHQPLGDYNGAWKELEKALEMGLVTQGTDTSVLKHRYRSRIYIDTFMVGMSRRDGLLILVFRNYVVGI